MKQSRAIAEARGRRAETLAAWGATVKRLADFGPEVPRARR